MIVAELKKKKKKKKKKEKKRKRIGSGTRRVPSGRVKRVPVETNGTGQ